MQKPFDCDTIYRDYVCLNHTFYDILYFFVEMGVFMLQLLSFSTAWEEIFKAIKSFDFFPDILDIILVAFIIYSAIKLIRETKAVQLIKGLILFIIVYAVVNLFDMQASSYIFSLVFSNLLLVLVIVFAPEIRHALESVGRSSVSKINFFGIRSSEEEKYQKLMLNMINSVCRASSDMSDKKIGALMVFEQETNLGEIIATGTPVDATVSPEIIGNVFYPKAPLHDGAAVFRDGRICAAGCILPLTQTEIGSELGTRHRASVGMSEQSDAVVVVVSEETGAISVAYKGRLKRNISDGDLREIMTEHFLKSEDVENNRFKNLFRGHRKNGQDK